MCIFYPQKILTYLKFAGVNQKNNGAPITSYTIYRRLVDENGKKNAWIKEKTLSNAVSRSFTVTLDWGKHYEFVVTATNSLGEAKKEENKIKDIQVEKGRTFRCFEYFCKSGGAVFIQEGKLDG